LIFLVTAGYEQCHCKDEVDREEAEALATALDQSSLEQSQLPHIPGLSSPSDTVHIHQAVSQLTHMLFYFTKSKMLVTTLAMNILKKFCLNL
jgi:hypothetical protein